MVSMGSPDRSRDSGRGFSMSLLAGKEGALERRDGTGDSPGAEAPGRNWNRRTEKWIS